MLDFLAFTLIAVFSLLALVSIALVAREAVARCTAGPIRFRLPMASASAPWPRNASWLDPLRGLRLRDIAAYGWVRMCLLLALLSIVLCITSRKELLEGPSLMLIVALVQCSLSFRLARRDANRWLVLSSGFLSLAIGGVVLAVELWAIHAGDGSAHRARETILLVGSVVFLVIGAAVIQIGRAHV